MYWFGVCFRLLCVCAYCVVSVSVFIVVSLGWIASLFLTVWS